MMQDHFFRTITVEAYAVQWDGTAHDAHRIIMWADQRGVTLRYACDSNEECEKGDAGHYLVAHRLDQNARIDKSGWLVEDHRGGVSIVTDEEFTKVFTPFAEPKQEAQ